MLSRDRRKWLENRPRSIVGVERLMGVEKTGSVPSLSLTFEIKWLENSIVHVSILSFVHVFRKLSD